MNFLHSMTVIYVSLFDQMGIITGTVYHATITDGKNRKEMRHYSVPLTFLHF